MVLNTRYTRRKAPSTRVVVMSPTATGTRSSGSLARSWAAMSGDSSIPPMARRVSGEGEGDPPGTDRELEGGAVSGQLGQEVDRRPEHVIGVHPG